MKKFATLALLAVIAYAQTEPADQEPAATTEPEGEDTSAATTEPEVEDTSAATTCPEADDTSAATTDPVLPLPDQAVATDIAFTFNISRAVDSQVAQLSDGTTPPAPETQGVTGTITASTDAEGVGSIAVDLKGYWAAQFYNHNKSKDLVGNMALEFRQNKTVTTAGDPDEETGCPTTVSSQVTNAETVVVTGSKDDAAAGTARAQQWDSSSITFAGGWDYQTPISDFIEAPQQLTIWRELTGSWIDNGEQGDDQYFFGFALTGNRPFLGNTVNFENKGTTTVTGATWVTKKEKREFNRGTMTYTVDLAMPVVEDDVPVDNTGTGDNSGGEPTGASALSAATAAAVAVLALAF